jgi:hypothetical protein
MVLNYLSVSAQTNVRYSYDESGNRTQRWIEIIPMAYHTTGNDTTTEFQVNKLLKQTETLAEEKSNTLPENEQSTVKIYPNPVMEKINIDIPEGASVGSLLLYDGNGRLVLSQTNVSTHNELDLSAQNKGNYFLVFQTTSGKRYFWKLVRR